MTHSHSIDSAQLDRLVDGELPADEYRNLLAQLEGEPDGWRRLALAFLEAQAWRRELASVAALPSEGKPAAAMPVKEVPVLAEASETNWRQLGLAMAASFLLAFSLAWYGQSVWMQGGDVIGPPLAAPNGLPGTFAGAQLAPASGTAREALERVKVTIGEQGADRKEFELPVVEVNSLAAARAAMNRSAISPEADRALEQTGVKVRRQQQYLSVELEDGRRMVVPVEQVELVPAETKVAWQ